MRSFLEATHLEIQIRHVNAYPKIWEAANKLSVSGSKVALS
jgi:hypothetical protein